MCLYNEISSRYHRLLIYDVNRTTKIYVLGPLLQLGSPSALQSTHTVIWLSHWKSQEPALTKTNYETV